MRCPKQNVRSWGAKLHVIIQHSLGLGERWFLYPPCVSCPLALGGGDFILSWAECWGEEGKRSRSLLTCLLGLWRASCSLALAGISKLLSHWWSLEALEGGVFFMYVFLWRRKDVFMWLVICRSLSLLGYLSPQTSAFWVLFPLSRWPWSKPSGLLILSLPLMIFKRETPQMCAISRNQHYPLISSSHILMNVWFM